MVLVFSHERLLYPSPNTDIIMAVERADWSSGADYRG
jgi:hypothetical protein